MVSLATLLPPAPCLDTYRKRYTIQIQTKVSVIITSREMNTADISETLRAKVAYKMANLTREESRKSLKSLPAEIVIKILEDVDVTGGYNMMTLLEGKQKYRTFIRCLIERFDPAFYLHSIVPDGQALLDLMSDSFVYLSRSAATEYFRPGSMTDSSSLDFYAPSYECMVSRFMEGMEEMGVVWSRSAGSLVRKALNRGCDTTIGLRESELPLGRIGNLVMSEATGVDVVYGTDAIYHLPATCPLRLRVVVDRNVAIIERDPCPGSNDWNDAEVQECTPDQMIGSVRGSLSYRGKKRLVRLQVEERPHLLDPSSLFECSSSCAQSYISGHVAFSMFGKMTFDFENVHWRLNNYDEVDVGWKKYRERGYDYGRLIMPIRGHSVQHLDGEYSTYVEGFNISRTRRRRGNLEDIHLRSCLFILNRDHTPFALLDKVGRIWGIDDHSHESCKEGNATLHPMAHMSNASKCKATIFREEASEFRENVYESRLAMEDFLSL